MHMKRRDRGLLYC